MKLNLIQDRNQFKDQFCPFWLTLFHHSCSFNVDIFLTALTLWSFKKQPCADMQHCTIVKCLHNQRESVDCGEKRLCAVMQHCELVICFTLVKNQYVEPLLFTSESADLSRSCKNSLSYGVSKTLCYGGDTTNVNRLLPKAVILRQIQFPTMNQH